MKIQKQNITKGVLLLLLAAFLYSLMPILIRFLGSEGIPPISQVFLRYIFAFLSAVLYYVIVSKRPFALPKKSVPLLLFASIFGYGLTNLFFTIGILNTEVSNALFLFYTYAILAPLLGFFILKDQLNKFNIVSLIMSLLALCFLFQPTSFTTWQIGAFFAILSALAQASYLISRKQLPSYSASYLMVINTFLGILVVGLLSLFFESSFYFQGGITDLSFNTWVVTILFGINNFLAWLVMTKGFEYFNATSASIILLSELIFGVIFAFLFFQEIPTVATFVGGMLILIASMVVIMKGKS